MITPAQRAEIRALCDWLVVHQVLPSNSAASVRGPTFVVTEGATPVADAGRDAVAPRLERYGDAGGAPRSGSAERDGVQLRAGERGGGDAAPGLHPAGRAGVAAAAREGREAARSAGRTTGPRRPVEAYLAVGGLEAAKAPLFQSVDRSGRLSRRPLGRRAVLAMDQSGGRRPPVHVTPQQHNSCSYPAPENRVPLGDFATCHGAVVSAKARGYTTANCCYWCANDCAGVSARHGSADRSATRVGP